MVSAALAWLTFLLYVAVYTPLKPLTTLNTAVGAIPGALPPVIGWAAATGRLGAEAWALFLIVFLWQFPHFLAIAWIYRDDYARGRLPDAADSRSRGGDHRPAGRRLRPGIDPRGSLAGDHRPGRAGSTSRGRLALGLAYLYYAVRFWSTATDRSAGTCCGLRSYTCPRS